MILLAFLSTWFYQYSRGSTAIAAFVHGSLNALSELCGPRLLAWGSPFFTNPFGLTTALTAFFLVIMLQQGRWKAPQAAAKSPVG